MKILLFSTALLSLLPWTYSSKDNTHYLAAVVEYSPESDAGLSGLELVLRNVKHYEALIANARSRQVDIIVFPEVGLTGVAAVRDQHIYMEVPHPNASISPCLQPEQWAEPLRRLSCAARENRIYVAVNLEEQSGSKRYTANRIVEFSMNRRCF